MPRRTLFPLRDWRSLGSRLFAALSLSILLSMSLATDLAGQGSGDIQPARQPNELIILLSAESSTTTAEELVDLASRNEPLPGVLGADAPRDARFLVSDRARGATRQANLLQPNSPEARLQRYVVLRYPESTDIVDLARRLRADPDILHVSLNGEVGLSLVPNDPFFSLQWGHDSLSLPTAWDTQGGHAYVAVVDTGIDPDHPDLAGFDIKGKWIGGSYRPFLSYDYGFEDSNPDENQPQLVPEGCSLFFSPQCEIGQPNRVGHGTHVSGIVAASVDNSEGVAGACQNCSLIVGKFSTFDAEGNLRTPFDKAISALNGVISKGPQVISMSFGARPGTAIHPSPDCTGDPFDPFCSLLELAEDRDIIMSAAAGNDGSANVDFPASDSRVFGVVGIRSDGQLWDDCPASGSSHECGSNYGSDLFNAPAKTVASTFYRGKMYVPEFACDDSTIPPDGDGYGYCSGTSMAAPYLAGVASILRSANPLLSKFDIETILEGNLEIPSGWSPEHGKGRPNAARALDSTMGQAGGEILANRLTPLFELYSFEAETHLSTTAPQMAAAAIRDSEVSFTTRLNVPLVGGYGRFPSIGCIPINPAACALPRASVYVFTTKEQPGPTTPPLVPLYRMGFDESYGGNAQNRSFFYTTEQSGLELGKKIGYDMVGTEGYIYSRCSPEPSCIPAGAVRLYRLYHPERDDYALFPESELDYFQGLGYESASPFNDWIGYVYPNVDSDGDHVIDGFEILVGTDPQLVDSDSDGFDDGVELLEFPYGDPVQPHFQCNPPVSGDWIVTESCTVLDSTTAPAGVVVQNDAVLTIATGVYLDIDFRNHELLVANGSQVLVENGGKIE